MTEKVLFDYKIQNNIYLIRCKPILEQMLNCGLLKKLFLCKDVKEFNDLIRFNSFDLLDISNAKLILEQILINPSSVDICTSDDLENIVKIISKKYLMNSPQLKPYSKVQIKVILSNQLEKIQVVSYNNIDSKDPGGTIENNEKPIDAAVRELKEELGLIVNKNRLELISSNRSLHKFKLVLNDTETSNYIKHIHNLDIDPEITKIIIKQI